MKKINILISEILNISQEEASDDLSINSTDNWDSLKHMELIVGIEETYNIKLEADDIVKMTTLKEIKKILSKKGIRE